MYVVHIAENASKSERPDLTAARVVISGTKHGIENIECHPSIQELRSIIVKHNTIFFSSFTSAPLRLLKCFLLLMLHCEIHSTDLPNFSAKFPYLNIS